MGQKTVTDFSKCNVQNILVKEILYKYFIIKLQYFPPENFPALLPDFSTELQVDNIKLHCTHDSSIFLNRFNLQTQVRLRNKTSVIFYIGSLFMCSSKFANNVCVNAFVLNCMSVFSIYVLADNKDRKGLRL